jgi:hypothetical protein
MGMPLLIGAGVGALSSAAMGKSPFTGALMGGALGGLGGAGGLFGGAAGSGAGATAAATEGGLLSSAAPVVGDAAFISPFTPTGVFGQQVGSASLNGIGSTLGASGTEFAAQNAPTYAGQQGMFDVAGNQNQVLGGIGRATYGDAATAGGASNGGLFGNVKDMFSGMSTSDKLGLGLKGVEALNQPNTPMQTPPVAPIQRGSFDPSSAIPATPTFNLTKEELAKAKAGQIANMAHLTDQDKRKIGDFYTSLIG